MTTQNFRVYAYLRASTEEQDATRARKTLENFAKEKNIIISNWFIENESGTKLDRPELHRLINSTIPGDILLVEHVDRLTRLDKKDWRSLFELLRSKGIFTVYMNLSTTHDFLNIEFRKVSDKFSIMETISNCIVEVYAQVAYEDNVQRKIRQAEGIAKKKAAGGWKGRGMTQRIKEKLPTIIFLLQKKVPQREIAKTTGVSLPKVTQINKEYITRTITVKQKPIN